MTATACPLCKSSEFAVYLDAPGGVLDADSLGSSRKHVAHGTILRCRACRFVFSQLRPADDELHKLYRSMDPTTYLRESEGRRRTARRHLNILERYVRPGRLVDVGCASGVLLLAAADAGWQVTGIEPSEVLWRLATTAVGERGEVLCTTLQEADLTPASFDALTLWDVLEHVTEPVKFLQHAASLVKPGGHLFVNVPDIDSAQARLLGKRWPLFLAEHLNYFTRATLNQCALSAGLLPVANGVRPASFSLEYVLSRLAHHKIPGAGPGHGMVRSTAFGRLRTPVYLGETYAVWRRPE